VDAATLVAEELGAGFGHGCLSTIEIKEFLATDGARMDTDEEKNYPRMGTNEHE
jgi:hypothetical protein